MTLVPPLKCQGIKTKLVPWIKSVVPTDWDGCWIEPFMGSGSVAFNVQANQILLADSNPHIIGLYSAIASGVITATSTRKFLDAGGKCLNSSDGAYYYDVRDRFNTHGSPLDFLFLNRACFNGMMRFNRAGGFNVPFCKKPERFSKAYVTKICNQVQAVADVCDKSHVVFMCQGYAQTVMQANTGDIIYCDSPYLGRTVQYFNGWTTEDEEMLAGLLAKTKARFILSTWHSNEHRSNTYLDTLWSAYRVQTHDHFYHVGAKVANRKPVREALVTNF